MAKKAISKKATKPTVAKAKPTPAPPKGSTWTLEETLRQLESLGNAGVRAQNSKSGPLGNGAGDNQFGVSRGDVRALAKNIKTNHELALALWKTVNIDAQFLAALLIKVDLLSAVEMERLVKSTTWIWVADWLYSYVLKEHADKETLRQKWMKSDDLWTARAGWQLTAGRVSKSPEGLDLEALLDRIEKEMSTAVPEVRWTMNMCLAEIGIHFPKHRKRALAIGENLGVYRDYPCSKGCTSPFVPIWINEMVRRQG
ncbi:MAG: DNA alkylation repair protein [Planctomycetes bacterium]|nr:DNA alkylation repair protein [Planctomycetota bacterium]